MNNLRLLLMLMALLRGSVIAVEIEQRAIQTESGTFAVSMPKGWPVTETNKTDRNTIYYRIGPADTNYSVQLHFNNPFQIGTNRLVESALEGYVTAALKPVLKMSVEEEVETHRFGAKKDGVYARLTDRTPKEGEYKYYTSGVRLIGTNVLVFMLVSNDKDFSALSNTLAVVESVRVVPQQGKTSNVER